MSLCVCVEFGQNLPSSTSVYGVSMLSVRAHLISSRKRLKSRLLVEEPSMKCGPACMFETQT